MKTPDITIGPMTEETLLWRCLHGGPLSKETLEAGGDAKLRALNAPILAKLIRTYGTCAILVRDGHETVGFLRFYPKAILAMEKAGHLCMQCGFPAGPSEGFVEERLPPLAEIEDKILIVHCLMVGSPFQEANPYQRKGFGSQMVRELICWARRNGWEAIEARGREDLDILYEHTGHAGKMFWEKLGFCTVETHQGDGSNLSGELLAAAREQAEAQGLDPDSAANEYTMRLGLV